MKSVGVDLHKKTITVCVMAVVDGARTVLARKRLQCSQSEETHSFFQSLGKF
jgi:hypothetical protein